MLSEAALRHLSKNDQNNYDFDLSTIHVSYYEPLFRTLQRFAIKNVESLGFNCCQLTKHMSRMAEGRQLPNFIESSIAHKKTHYARNIIELLSFISPRSSTLYEIRFSYIYLRREHLERLATIIAKSPNIRSISFFHVPIGDEGIKILLTTMNPDTLQYISVVRCNLTGVCTPKIVKFINRRSDPKNGIKSFEVSQSEFCLADRKRIADALAEKLQTNKKKSNSNQMNKNKKKVGFNNSIDELQNEIEKSRREGARAAAELVEINENDALQNHPNQIEKNNSENLNDGDVEGEEDQQQEKIENSPLLQENSDDFARRAKIQHLKTENTKIEAQINILKDMINSQNVGPSLFAIGPGSTRFSEYLSHLEQRLIELDKTPRMFP